jgi:multidrug efflux pump subunit AcrA (membrane-fusion protein)
MTKRFNAPALLRVSAVAWLAVSVASCGSDGSDGSNGSDGGTTAAAVDSGPRPVEVVRVVEQPLDVELSLPGELAPYQAVAIYPRVAGFVKTVNVDRGSMVRAGDVLATIDAPELIAQRSEAQSKLQAAEAQLAVTRARADAARGTFERLKAASATPGVVAGNEVVVAEKAAEAGQSEVTSAQQIV